MPTVSARTCLALLLLVDFVSLLLLSMSAAMFVDFAHRLLSADPDSLGIATIGVQAAVTVAASSTFTKSGSAVLSRFLGGGAQNKSLWRFGFAVALFVGVYLSWVYLPERLAQHYNTYGYNLNHSIDLYRNGTQDYRNKAIQSAENPQFQRAAVLRSYQRAVALDPSFSNAHTDAGEMLETFYRYDEAVDQYKQAILSERADAIDLVPYAQLARLQLLKDQPEDAMRIIADAQVLRPGFDANSNQSLYRSKAWAEYDLGFYAAAVADASSSNSAAGTCIAAKAYEKLRQAEDARTAWAKFEAQYKAITPDDLLVEPDCPILAAEANHEAK